MYAKLRFLPDKENSNVGTCVYCCEKYAAQWQNPSPTAFVSDCSRVYFM